MQITKRGFTFVEVIVVLAIISVLLLASYSSGSRGKETQIGERAQWRLLTIFDAEKRYKMEMGVYKAAASLTIINQDFLFFMMKETVPAKDAADFTYSISLNAAKDVFTVTAVRAGKGICKGKAMYVSSADGLINKSGCKYW